MSATASLQDPAPVGRLPVLSAAQWRALGRLCRWIEQDERTPAPLFGPRARDAARALREASSARRRRPRDASAMARAAPTAVLARLADAAAHWAARLRERPAGFYAPDARAVGPGLLLQMPTLKAWLQQAFPLEAALQPQAPAEAAAARAREVLIQQCLSLSDSEDGFHRRRQLLQMLSAHGHRQPLLRLAQRAARDWAPKGWAESWEQVAGIDEDERALAALERASAAAAPALQTWSRQPPAGPTATQGPAAAPSAETAQGDTPASPLPPGSGQTGPDAQVRTDPINLRAWQSPSRWTWLAAGAAVISIGVGLLLHLWPREGPASARWVTFYEADGTSMAIDPDSIRRDGRQLSYRVGVVDTRDNSSMLAHFTAHCDTRLRRLESVQHYRGTRYETATRYEPRGTSTSPWPSGGADVRLMLAACGGSSRP